MTQSSQNNCNPQLSQPFFNIHTYGYGRVLRIREVQTRGAPFWACTIAAYSGPRSNLAIRYIDVRVVGNDAINFIRNSKPDVDAEKTVVIDFRVGDLWTQMFADDKAADGVGLLLKGRLLKVVPKDPKFLDSQPHFDLLTRAYGRLNYVNNGEALTCAFGAFKGKIGAPEFCNFDLSVCSDEAARLILDQAAAVRAKRKVNISVLLDDLEPNYYVPTTGSNAGKRMTQIRSKLVEVSTIKVDGEEVFRAKSASTDDPAREDAPAAESASAPQASSEQQPPKGKAKNKHQKTATAQQPDTVGSGKAPAKPSPALQQVSEFDESTEWDDIPF